MTRAPVGTLFSVGLFLWALLSVAAVPASVEPRPNVLLILADDLGWSDLGCYGGEIHTPNLDRLAAGGARFSQCYTSSRCCPSRASLLTGLYPHQAGIGQFVRQERGAQPGYLGRLTDRCVTLAEVLRPAGYRTYASGKWHVNEPGPIERGFDEFYGFVHGYAVDSWDPGMMIRLPAGRPTRSYAPGRYFATNAITDHALDFLDLARRKAHPWLLYVAYQAPHFPLQASAELIAKYEPIYARGWDTLRAERLDRMKVQSLFPGDMKSPPRSPIDNAPVPQHPGSPAAEGVNPAWDSLSLNRRADLARRMATYAAMVEHMDANIGRLVTSLRQHGELEKTLILFLSDNGACAEWGPFGFDLPPGALRKPKPGHGIEVGTGRAPNVLHEGAALAALGGPGSLFSYGSAWANLSNTPLSFYKHYTHEGGLRAPLIVHWPAMLAGRRGGWCHHVVHLMDVMPTCVEISGARYPSFVDGREIPPLEGRSLLPALLGQPEQPRTLVFAHDRNAALREGSWKLVGRQIIGREGMQPDAGWELYDVQRDPAEQRDLAAENPHVVKRLTHDYLQTARRTFILPSP